MDEFNLFGDPDELQRRMAEFAEQMQSGQRVAWADNAISLAVDMTVAAIDKIDAERQQRRAGDADPRRNADDLPGSGDARPRSARRPAVARGSVVARRFRDIPVVLERGL